MIICELHWLPLEFRIQYKLAVLAFRHFEGTLPTNLSATLCTYKPARSLRSSTERLLKSPHVNLKSAGERSFHFAAPAVWDLLPNSLRNIHSLLQFKKQLKTHIFLHAFLDSQMYFFFFFLVFVVCAPYKNPPLLLLLIANECSKTIANTFFNTHLTNRSNK